MTSSGVVISLSAGATDPSWPGPRHYIGVGTGGNHRYAAPAAAPRQREVEMTAEEAWRAANRANWDERVAVHLGPRGYDLGALRGGRGRLHAIEEAELGAVSGLR